MALMNESLVARKALAAYLMSSAVAGSVTMNGAGTPRYSEATRMAALWSSLPTTMRSGCRKSWTAVPSRRNSGLDTTDTSGRRSTRSTTLVEPTGTVDLLTTTAPSLEVVADLGRRRLEVAQVGRAVDALGRGHAEVDELGVGHRGDGAEHEVQPARAQPVGDEVLETGLDDRDLAAVQSLDLLGDDVGTDDVVTRDGRNTRQWSTRHSPHR